MSAKRIAVRYAKALIEALAEKEALDEAEGFLDFCRLARENAELGRLFANVTVAAEDKVRVVASLTDKLGLGERIGNFLRLLAQNGRLDILTEIEEAVAEALDTHRHIQAVHLTTASEASPEALARFESAMKQLLGSEIRIEAETDPSLLGGAIARVGSFVYDGSVAAHLTRLRRELTEEK